MKKLSILILVLVILASCFLFLFKLDSKPFWDYDEATYAIVVKDTIKDKDILTLHSGGNTWFAKPPLLFWLSMGVNSIFHNPEFSYRLTAALAGIASVILTILIAYELSGDFLVASLAGFILLTTGPFLKGGRELRLDVPAIAAILFSVYSFLRGLRKSIWFMGIGSALAVGFMFKSILGLFGLIFLFFWALWNWNFKWIKSSYLWLGGLLFIIILIPWHAYEFVHYGQNFWNNYFAYPVLGRVGNNVIGSGVTFGSYVKFFLNYASPWSIIFVLLFFWLISKWHSYNSNTLKPIFISFSTALAIFILFLLSPTKLLDYLLPVYPFMALAIALVAGYVFKNNHKAVIVSISILPVIALYVSIGFGFHLFSYIAVNDTIVNDEKNAGLIIGQDKNLDLYAYQYQYYDTIEYYSGRRNIQVISDNQLLNKPFFLVVSKPYMDWHSFPPELARHLATLYKGQALILYKFVP